VEGVMGRACFTFKVRRERFQEYLTTHKDIWPEVLDAINLRSAVKNVYNS
jgi:L-rhamnose mutarotase